MSHEGGKLLRLEEGVGPLSTLEGTLGDLLKSP